MGTITRRRDVIIVIVGPQESKEVGGMVFWGHTPTGAVHSCVEVVRSRLRIPCTELCTRDSIAVHGHLEGPAHKWWRQE